MGLNARSGFTLIEAIVGVAIAAALAAAFYASFGRAGTGSAADDRAQRAGATAISLFDIATAIASLETTNPPTSYLQTVGAYPGTLSQLTIPITTSDRNSCNQAGDTYSGAAVPNPPANPGYVLGWAGPYYTVAFTPNGATQLAPGFVTQDSLIRIPANPVSNPKGDEWAGRLQIRMTNVTLADAQALDTAVDFFVDGTAGTVRYAATDPTSVNYELRVSRC